MKLVLAIIILLISINVSFARDACSRDSDCTAPERCTKYSSSTYVDCNALGRLFGCKTSSGFCGLFCSNEVLFALRCTSTCTTNAQCQAGETCKGSTTQKFCVRL
jgi:hypothetical protein